MKKIVSVTIVHCVPSTFFLTPCVIMLSSLLVDRVQLADVSGSETSSFRSIYLPVTGLQTEKAIYYLLLRSLNVSLFFLTYHLVYQSKLHCIQL